MKLRLLRVMLVLPVIAILGMTLTSCTGKTIKLWVSPATYKFTKAGTKNFNIQVTGIGEVFIDNVELIPGTSFKFPGGVSKCIGAKVGDNVSECIETVELPTYQSGLSAELKVTVKNLSEKAQISS